MKSLLGVSTFLWTSPFCEDSIHLFPAIRSIGFDAVEIGVENTDTFDPAVIKQAADDNGLKLSVSGAFGTKRDLTSDNPDIVRNSMNYIQDCLKLSETWGCPHFAGPMYSAVGKARMLTPEQRRNEWDRAVNNLQKVCTMAHDMGVKIAIEPLNRFETDLVNTAAEAIRLIRDINHPAAGVSMDSFHMSIEEQDMESAIRTVGSDLIHMQVSENHRGIPGRGQTDWSGLMRGLEAIDYSGMIIIESFTTEIQELAAAVCFWTPKAESQDLFAKESLHFLKKWIQTETKEKAIL